MSQALMNRRKESRRSIAVMLSAKKSRETTTGLHFVADDGSVCVPSWVRDHASFRRWFHSDEFPETGRISFLNGEVYVDMSREQLYSHNQMKTEITRVLAHIAVTEESGLYFSDGVHLTHVGAELSANPDGVFVNLTSFDDGRVREIEGARDGLVELEGSPDLVLEVVSPSSVVKDYEIQRDSYWRAGIREYWLIDVRGDGLHFEILRHTARGYVATRLLAGWQKSAVLGKSFRLTRATDKRGQPKFQLFVR
ncbi:MAG: Uma2 family endonuclease [Planctomycetaceae bacterium]